jgi:hypothetical protein
MSWSAPETIDYTASGDTVYTAVDALDLNQDDIYTKLNYYGDNLVPYDQFASIAAAVAAIGSTPCTLFINDAVTLSASTEFVSTLDVWVGPGGSINVSSHTLTISGGFHASSHSVFTGTSGSIIFPSDCQVRSSWFASLGAMITLLSSNATTVLIDAPFLTTESLTFPATTTLTWNCANNKITVGNATHVITVHGPIIAGDFQIIDNIESGTVTLLGYPYNAAWLGGASTVQTSGLTIYTPQAFQWTLQSRSNELTLSGSATDWTNAIPAGVLLLGVSAVVTQTITSASGTSWGIGTTTDLDRWGLGLSFALNTTSGFADYAADSSWPLAVTSATTIRIDCNGTSYTFTGGKVRITIFYATMTAPTS